MLVVNMAVAVIMVMSMIVMMMATIMVVTRVIVMLVNHRHRRLRLRLQRAHKTAALGPDQAGTECRDQAIACDLDCLFPLHIVLAVEESSQARTATSDTATSACKSAEANDSTMPRRAVSSLATR